MFTRVCNQAPRLAQAGGLSGAVTSRPGRNNAPSRLRDESGLTLAELMVCLGIVAILVSICYPLIEEYRTRAWNTHPLSDLRNAVTAVQAMPESVALKTCHGSECEEMYPGLQLSDCTQMSLTPVSNTDMMGVACCRKGNRTLGNRYYLYSPEAGQVIGVPYASGVECMLGALGSSSSGGSSSGGSGFTAGGTGSSSTATGSGTTAASSSTGSTASSSGAPASCGGMCSSCSNTCPAGMNFNGCMQANATGPMGITLDICVCVASCLPSLTSSGLLGSSSGVVAGLVSGVASTGLVSSSGTVAGLSGSGASGSSSGTTTTGTATSSGTTGIAGSSGLLGGVAGGVAGTVSGTGLVSGTGGVTTAGATTVTGGTTTGTTGATTGSSGLVGGVVGGVVGSISGTGLVSGSGTATTGGTAAGTTTTTTGTTTTGTTTGVTTGTTTTTSSGLVGGLVGGG